MATRLYLREASAPDTHLGTNNANLRGTSVGWIGQSLATTAGAASTASDSTATVAGTTPGVEITVGAITQEWISPPVSADVTISGTITANIWGAESNMSANVAINVVIEIIRANVTATANSNTLVEIVRSTRVTELAVTTPAVNNFTTGMTSGAYTPQTLNRGDRLRIRVFGDDAGTMAAGFTFAIKYGGPTGGADGDTWVEFTETCSFESAPAGSQLFLTNVQSGLSGAPALISDFTGANENPLSEGGNWALLDSTKNPLQRISNAASASVAAAQNGSYWTPGNFGPDLDAYVTVSTATGTTVGVLARVQGEGGAATWDGYAVLGSTGAFGIFLFTNSVQTTLLLASGSIASGDKIGIRCSGSTIQAWRQASGSSDWNLAGTVVDTTYASAGKIGLFDNGNTSNRMDDFYAATDSNLFTQKAWTSRGAGVVSYRSDTDAGWVAPLYTQDWYTPQLSAVTLQGMAQANLRALESAVAANASLRCEIAVVNSDGSNPTVWATWCISENNTRIGELNTSESAETGNISGDSLAVSNGQRLRIRLYLEDTPFAAMGAGQTVTFFYNGTSAAASGDSYVTMPVTLTEFVAGAVDDVLMKVMQAVNRSNVY